MIIDAHMHLGEDLIYNTNDDEAVILQYMEENGIGGAILQTGMKTYDDRKANLRIFELTKQYPGMFWGITALSPHMPEEEYWAFAKWTVEELGFKGLKLHPGAFACMPTSPQARKAFDTAAKLEIPLMIHTGNGVPTALPSMVIPMALKYPQLKIVLAHAGGGMYGCEALVAAQVCPNIYLETSWCPPNMVKSFVDEIGCARIMFGTDVPINAGAEIGKYRSLKLSEEQFARCCEGTAREVFQLR